jgi:hypothetical protein
MPVRPLPSLAAVALISWHALALSFEAKVTDPDFTIVVPALPNIALRQQPASPASAPRLLGDDGTYQVAVAISAMPQGVLARECAASGLRSILSQPGMPHRDSIYRAPLSVRTFLVLYVRSEGAQATLHAHLLSVAGEAHCTDVHFSRLQRAGEDVDDWRSSFSGARIDEPAR